MKKLLAVAGAGAVCAFALWWMMRTPRPENQKPGKFPEELVYVRTQDDVVQAGAMFTPPKDQAKAVAIVWIHGWGANFYSPTYAGIGRELAARGYTTLSANTRMHDIGNVLKYSGGKRVRGGGYWGVASEEVRDLEAWIAYAGQRGFGKVILVGHSAGWSAVRQYQADTQDERVVGVVLASGQVRAGSPPDNAELIAQARRMVADGAGDDLLRLPNRSFPSFVSAATFLDSVDAAPEFMDFFGTKGAEAAVTRVRCPLLAFFGDRESQVGGEEDLQILKSSVERLPSGPRPVTTVMIQSADHMYTGQESQVAQVIAQWANKL